MSSAALGEFTNAGPVLLEAACGPLWNGATGRRDAEAVGRMCRCVMC